MPKSLSVLVSTLLLLPILLALPSAQSQAYTTITTQTTSLRTINETSIVTIDQSTTITGQLDILDHHVGELFLNGIPGTSFPLPKGWRNVVIPTNSSAYTSCYFIAFSFNATEGQTFSGSMGPANVDVGLFVTDNRSFYSWELPYLANPGSWVGCTSEGFFHNFTPIVNLQPMHPYWNVPPNYTAPLRNYAVAIPSSGQWWMTGWVNRLTSVNPIRWDWSAFLSPQTYVTTMTSYSTSTNQFTVSTTIDVVQTENLSQSLAQTFTLTFSAEQLYAGLAAIFGVLLVVTVGLLVKQRRRRTKRRR